MRNNIPLELRQLPQWVVAAADKKPLDPKTGGAASVTDSTTWAAFDVACAYADQYGLRVGFVLAESDPYTIIDLDDKAERPATDEQKARFAKIIEKFVSYTERSQSGRGVHIVVRGKMPAGVHRDGVEVYSSARYMICTGDVMRPLEIADRQDLLDVLYGEMKPAPQVELEEREELQDDASLVEMAMRAINGDKFNLLCAGEWAALGYESASEADHALLAILAFYSPSNEQVKRLFRMSALGKRDKHRGTDYRIDLALRKIRANEPMPVDLEAMEELAAQVATAPQAPIPAPSHSLAPRLEGPVTGELLPPPGLVGELAQYIYSSAIRPVPEVALAAALGLVAGVAGRTYYTSGLPTGLNLYLILLAKTGIGKEGGKQGINRLLSEISPSIPTVSRFIGPTSFASGQALVKHFEERPCFYSVLDEFGHTLKRITTPKASGAEQALHSELLALYSRSGPDGFVGVQAYSDKEKNTAVVRAPSLTIIGESTPEVFFGCLDSALVQDGLVPRLLVIEYTGGRPPRNRYAGGKPDATLVRRFADLVTVAVHGEQNGSFAKVHLAADAEALLDAFDRECDDHINGGNAAEVQLWNRAHLNALKVASVIGVGCNPYQPLVTVEHARWAVEFVRRSVHAVQSRFDKGEVGGGDGAKAEAAIRTAVADFLAMPPEKRETYKTPKAFQTGSVIPHSYLYAKLKRVQPFKDERRLLDETLKALLEAGALQQLPPQQVREKFKLDTKAYCVGHSW